jgi:hypothetical protein
MDLVALSRWGFIGMRIHGVEEKPDDDGDPETTCAVFSLSMHQGALYV